MKPETLQTQEDSRQSSDALLFDEIDVLQSVSRESFYHFVREFWDAFIPEKFINNWHIQFLCGELQTIAERVFAGLPRLYDLVINVPPGSTKSTLCSIMFPAWCWTRMPSARFIGGSYSAPVALDLALRARDLVQCDLYRAAFPEIRLREDQLAKTYYRNTRGGSRYSVGVGGSVTGIHGHFLLIDDPIDPKAAASEAILKSANNWMNETLPTRKIDKTVTPTILIMQRLAQGDPTDNMIERSMPGRVRHICIPGEKTVDIRPPELAKNYVDGLMDPVRLPRSVLNEYFKQLGTYGYAGQINQHPVPREGAMFAVDKIRIETPPTSWLMRVRYWDKAGTEGGGARTAGVLMGLDTQKRFWFLDVQKGQWGIGNRNARMQATAERDGYAIMIWVEQEPGSGGLESAQNTVKQLKGYRVRADRVGPSEGNKLRRAEPLADEVDRGNVYMAPGEWNADLLEELEYFPKSKFKDQVDGSSGAFNKLNKPLLRAGAW